MTTKPYRFREQERAKKNSETVAVAQRVKMVWTDVIIHYDDLKEPLNLLWSIPVDREALRCNLTNAERTAFNDFHIPDGDVGIKFLMRSYLNPYRFAVCYRPVRSSYRIIQVLEDSGFINWVKYVTDDPDDALTEMENSGFTWEHHLDKALTWMLNVPVENILKDPWLKEEHTKIVNFLIAVAEDEKVSKLFRTLAYHSLHKNVESEREHFEDLYNNEDPFWDEDDD